MFQRIPLTASPSQTLDTTLGGQFVSLFMQSRNDKLYIDIYRDNEPIVLGRVCQNNNGLINENYRLFNGEMFFVDTDGNNDPVFNELGSRYLLIYWDGEDD